MNDPIEFPYFIKGTCKINDLEKEYLSYIVSQDQIKSVNPKARGLILYDLQVIKEIPEDENKWIGVKGDSESFFGQIHNRFHKNELTYKNKRTIGKFPKISEQSIIYNNVNFKNINTVTIDPGAVIGTEGFKFFKNLQGNNERLIHIGKVWIGNYVEIGSNTCIDSGTFKHTVIEDYVKIDNLCHIAHNVRIGRNSILTPFVCIGGSTVIGENVWIGIGAKIRQGLTIGDNSLIAMGSIVTRDVEPNTEVAGNFAIEKDKWIKHTKDLSL
jgi:acetyltransferase-like isoleucine patch superfamily enzyme